MGWVRLCAGVLSTVTLALTAYLLLETDSNSAICVILLCAALCLACIVPFPAISRSSRQRVFYVCLAFMLLTWFSTAAAFLTNVAGTAGSREGEATGLFLSGLSALLSGYAYRRKRLRRSSGWTGYLEKG